VLAAGVRTQPATTDAQVSDEPQHDSMRAVLGVGLRQREVLAAALAITVTGAVGGVLQLLVPFQLEDAGFDTGEIGLAFSATAGIYIAVSALVVRLGRRATTFRWATSATLALALAPLPAVFGSNAVLVIGMLLITTVPRAVLSAICYPLATRAAADARLAGGIVLGLLNATWAIGFVVAPLVASAFAQISGTQAAYLTAIVPGALGALLLLGRRPRVPAGCG
jgi:MFS family permease